MRIEAQITGKSPVFFFLKKPRMLLGSHEDCDIVIKHQGVSRKHLIILEEDDSFFIIDQGSTNGTFLNSERLVPGKKIEFNTFFPIRLGDDVLLTLLSDDDDTPRLRGDSQTTKVKNISNIEQHKIKTASSSASFDEQKIGVLKKHSREQKMNDSRSLKFLFMIGVALTLAVGIWNYQNVINSENEAQLQDIQNEKNGKVISPAEVKIEIPLVDKAYLPSPEKYPEIQNSIQCVTDVEKFLCDNLPLNLKGVSASGLTLFIFIDGKDLWEKSFDFLRSLPSLGQGENYPIETLEGHVKERLFVASAIYFYHYFPRQIDFTRFKDNNLVFIFKILTAPDKISYSTMAFTPTALDSILKILAPMQLEMIKKSGTLSISFFKQYAHYY